MAFSIECWPANNSYWLGSTSSRTIVVLLARLIALAGQENGVIGANLVVLGLCSPPATKLALGISSLLTKPPQYRSALVGVWTRSIGKASRRNLGVLRSRLVSRSWNRLAAQLPPPSGRVPATVLFSSCYLQNRGRGPRRLSPANSQQIKGLSSRTVTRG